MPKMLTYLGLENSQPPGSSPGAACNNDPTQPVCRIVPYRTRLLQATASFTDREPADE